MSTQFFKRSLLTRAIAFIIIFNFVFINGPVTSALAADALRPRAARTQLLNNELVVDLELLGKDDGEIGGGKAVNLGEMLQMGIPVPPGFTTTTGAFRQFVREGTVEISGKTVSLGQFIEERLSNFDYNDTNELEQRASEVRKAIGQTKMPAALEKKIREKYAAKLGNVAVAVRSSATAEDLPDASFAGQQATFLNVEGADDVVAAVKACFASLFETRAVLYRHENKIPHISTYLCAIVQKMATQVTPKAAGVAFSVNVVTGERNQITIEGTFGLGEKVVSGEGTPDTILLNRGSGKLVLQSRNLVAKPDKIVYRDRASIKPGEKATETVPTTPEERDNYCISEKEALKIGEAIIALEEHYRFIVDAEWVITPEGDLYIVQVRPEIPWNTQVRKYPNQKVVKKSAVKPESAATATIITAGLSGGSQESASGIVRVIKELSGVTDEERALDLARQMDDFPKGAILVAEMTNPSYLPAMKKAAGIVTDRGGRTCHAALVAREIGIPCVVGTSDATKKLTNGMEVTVDGHEEKGLVYAGKQPIERHEKIENLGDIPNTRTRVKITSGDRADAQEAYLYSTLENMDGVGLLRAEFALAKMPHVLAGLDYDRYYSGKLSEDERARIEEKVIKPFGAKIKEKIDEANATRHPKEKYKTFREYYIGTLAESIMGVTAAQHRGQPVIYRTTDFKTNEYRGLIGGSAYEPQENNPMLGYRGLYRMLSPQYREAFDMEIEAIKKAREVFPNIWVMFPVCRSPEEVKEAIELFAKHGLVQGQDGLKYIMMFEVPDNFFRMDKYLQYVDGFSIGSNDLTQLALGTGRDNEVLAALGLFNEANPALLNMIGWGIQVANKQGKSTGICGDAPSANPPYARHLVRFGIGSISVTQGVIPRVAIEIKKAEEEAERLGIDGVFFSKERYEKVKHLLTDSDKYPAHVVDWEEFDTMGNPEKPVASSVDAAELIRAIGIHPLALMQFARGEITDATLKQQIEAKLAGKSVRDFVVDAVYQAMMAKAAGTKANRMIVYTTDDLLKTDYEKMSGAGSFEVYDENPITGIFGLVRVLFNKDYRDFFAWQLEGLYNAYTKQPQRKFAIRFDGVIETKQIKDALDMVRAAGFEPGRTIQVGMELRTPGNVANLKGFIEEGQLSFLSENRDAFLAYNLALDPGNPYVDQPQANKDDSFAAAQRYWTNVAQQKVIPLVQFEGEAGITSTPAVPLVVPPAVPLVISPAKFGVGTVLITDKEIATGRSDTHYDMGFGVPTPPSPDKMGPAMFVTEKPAVAKELYTAIPWLVNFKGPDLQGKIVVDRVDWNIPNPNSVGRIQASLPGLIHVRRNGGTPIVLTHYGRPGGKVKPELSTKPLADIARRVLTEQGYSDIPVVHHEGSITENGVAEGLKDRIVKGAINVLENTRFCSGDEKNDSKFAKALAELAGENGIFVFDGFGAGERVHASTAGLAEYMERIALGPLVVNEENVIKGVMENLYGLIFGGGPKFDEKVEMLKKVVGNIKEGGFIIVGTGPLPAFLKALYNIEIGQRAEDKDVAAAKEIIELAEKKKVRILLPNDFVAVKFGGKTVSEDAADAKAMLASKKFPAGALLYYVTLEELKKNMFPVRGGGYIYPIDLFVYDIGQASIAAFKEAIANTPTGSSIVWNGSLGVNEMPSFEDGTKAVAITLGEISKNKERTGVVLGGDTGAAVEQFGVAEEITYVSTGGGASLALLEGKELAAIVKLAEIQTTINDAEKLDAKVQAYRNYLKAEGTIYKGTAGDAFGGYVNALKPFQPDGKTLVLIITPNFFKIPGVKNVLSKVDELNSVEIAVYGDKAEKLKALVGRNIITAEDLDSLLVELRKLNVKPQNILLLSSPEDEFDDATLKKLEEKKIRQIVAPDIATLGVAKAVKELFRDDNTRDAFVGLISEIDGKVIEKISDDTRSRLIKKLDSGTYAFPAEVKMTEQVIKDTEDARRISAKFMGSV